MNSSPFVFDVSAVQRDVGVPRSSHNTGPAPMRIGLPMLAIEQGAEVDVDAIFTSLGEGITVDATVTASLEGRCSRCLTKLTTEKQFHLNEVFAATETFIQGDPDDEAEAEVPKVHNNTVDLLQLVIDEAGLSLPFNPTCIDVLGSECPDNDVPVPDGISGEQERIDPRWAGLEKFK